MKNKNTGIFASAITLGVGGVAAYAYSKNKKNQQVIGIICPMETELEPLLANATKITVSNISGMTFYKGVLCRKKVVMVVCGVGKVNAAMCAEALITQFNVSAVINSGVAGTTNETLAQGDLVISTDAVHHDVDATALGCAMGEIPDMDVSCFKADFRLIEVAKEAATKLVARGVRVTLGRIASGDVFVQKQEDKKRIREAFEPYAVEMEGAAVAQVAYQNDVPFVIIRSISDSANGEANLEYAEFLPLAVKNSTELVMGMLSLK